MDRLERVEPPMTPRGMGYISARGVLLNVLLDEGRGATRPRGIQYPTQPQQLRS